ncbi:hypothetical protein LTR37_011966 [Vermiconidia calcicola]|uniref:Uncharacterized protein n=1 Tax=Vermiconidia calcicola TaxID=1690605 RepID=A0ACC3N1Z3_9PEZI|nr:hypothetical protein LTR37_011966 [Vermiconidia calcicola]
MAELSGCKKNTANHRSCRPACPKSRKPNQIILAEEYVEQDGMQRAPWRPVSLGMPYLSTIVLLTLALIASVEILVRTSKRDNGILFASKIDDLPRSKSLGYRYLPTLLAVLYGLSWGWIDLDTRRVEPWRQLAQPGGASGADSLLLQYPMDFLPIAPFKSFRRRHWPVFFSSCAVVLAAWAVTPLQAAMFAVDVITKSEPVPMAVSLDRLTLSQQAQQNTTNFSYSVYNIAWLNEQLPPYMSRQAALTPFQPSDVPGAQDQETWTSDTTLYSVDARCETARLVFDPRFPNDRDYRRYNSSYGCSVPYPYGPDGDDVVDQSTNAETKEYTAFYVAYSNPDGSAHHYLSYHCPNSSSNIFFTSFTKNKRYPNDTITPPTVIFCNPLYYQQQVTATVRRHDLGISNISASGEVQPLANDTFDTRTLESQLGYGYQPNPVRGDIPESRWPTIDGPLADLPINIYAGSAQGVMVGMAIGAYQRPAEEYLEPEILSKAYEAAYQLLFARAIVDTFPTRFTHSRSTEGKIDYRVEAVRIVCGFAYAVEGLLGVLAAFGLALIYISFHNELSLDSDPTSIFALMGLSSYDARLRKLCSELNQASDLQLEKHLSSHTYVLRRIQRSWRLQCRSQLDRPVERAQALQKPRNSYPRHSWCQQSFELSLVCGGALLLTLIGLILGLAYLFLIGKDNGIAMPGKSRFVRQILENYVPTILATLLEPVWALLTRQLATMQPLENLKHLNVPMQVSVKLTFADLPPQLVAFKAVRTRHFTLAAASLMCVLANVLAVAFSGMFTEERTLVSTSTMMETMHYGSSEIKYPYLPSSGRSYMTELEMTTST